MSISNFPLKFTVTDPNMVFQKNWHAVAGKNYGNFKRWEKDLKEQAKMFMNEISPQKKEISDKPQNLDELLKEYNGFCIGEAHHQSKPKRFIIENMADLKTAGVKTLYLEHLFYDSMQKNLDEALKSDGKLLPYLKEYLVNLDEDQMSNDKTFGFAALVEACLKNGIRVVGIDTTGSYYCGVDQKHGNVTEEKMRCLAMNYVASIIMQREQNKPEAGKWVALMGTTHTLRYKGIPGVAEILNVPAIEIKKTNEGLTPHLQQYYD